MEPLPESIAAFVHEIKPAAELGALAAAPAVLAQLREIHGAFVSRHEALARTRDHVDTGVAPGITAAFVGPSGRRKTLAADVIAKQIGLDLIGVDLGGLASKFRGETQPRLDLTFAMAERAGAVLLLDEAEALFGRRTDVDDAHDRYASVEMAYLLQKMERYRGLAILAIERRHCIDDAVARRLDFIVDFPCA